MRFKLFVLLMLFVSQVEAFWSGISLQLADINSDWQFSSGLREARSSNLSFEVEDKTETGLRIGAMIGYMTLRVIPQSAAAAQKFDIYAILAG